MYNMDDLKKKRLLTKDEAAFYIGINVRTLTEIAKRENFPVVRIGCGRGRVFINREKLDEWIDARTAIDKYPDR